jgi:hypothetical protein
METGRRLDALLITTSRNGQEAAMNAVLLLSHRRPPALLDDESRGVFEIDVNEIVVTRRFADGAEPLMAVSFVGLTEAEQRTALASFPGARRCYVAQN